MGLSVTRQFTSLALCDRSLWKAVSRYLNLHTYGSAMFQELNDHDLENLRISFE